MHWDLSSSVAKVVVLLLTSLVAAAAAAVPALSLSVGCALTLPMSPRGFMRRRHLSASGWPSPLPTQLAGGGKATPGPSWAGRAACLAGSRLDHLFSVCLTRRLRRRHRSSEDYQPVPTQSDLPLVRAPSVQFGVLQSPEGAMLPRRRGFARRLRDGEPRPAGWRRARS